MANYKTGILIQARLSSSRFPKKMLEKIGEYTLLEYVYNRCKVSNLSNIVAIITSLEKSDDKIVELCKDKNIPYFRGNLENVLDRYIQASNYFNIDLLCRVSGDSPFVDVFAIDDMFKIFNVNPDLEYSIVSNSLNGFLSEVVQVKTLKIIAQMNLSISDKEHVTKYIRDNIEQFQTYQFNINKKPKELKEFSLTVDYKNDLEIIKNIDKQLSNLKFTSDDIIRILREQYELSSTRIS